MSKTNRKISILTVLTVFVLIVVTIMPHFFGDSVTKVNMLDALQGPSAGEWFGTDNLGRSVFARAMTGGAETIFPAMIILFIVTVVGSLIGIISAFIGGKFDKFILFIITVFQSFPPIIFVVAIVGLLGVGLQQTMIAICITSWTKYAYLTRSLTQQLKREAYIEHAQMYGNRLGQVVRNYYLPSLFPQIITTMSFDISTIIMEIAGLSFIGLGAQVPSPEWGAMINEGRTYIQEAPWIVLFPCLLLVCTILLFTRLGDALQQKYNRI